MDVAERETTMVRSCEEAHPNAEIYCYPPEHPVPVRPDDRRAERRP